MDTPAYENEIKTDSEWNYPFTKENLRAWKSEFGPNNIHLVKVAIREGDQSVFVVRGLGRKEFIDLRSGEYRNNEAFEDESSYESLPISRLDLNDRA